MSILTRLILAVLILAGALGGARSDGIQNTTPGAGAWTPVLTGTTVAGSCTYANQVATYEQIGRLVTVRFALATTSCGTTPTGNMTITGLPVAQGSADSGQCIITFVGGWTGGVGYTFLSGAITTGTSVISVFDQGSSKTPVATPATEITFTATNIQGFCSYHT